MGFGVEYENSKNWQPRANNLKIFFAIFFKFTDKYKIEFLLDMKVDKLVYGQSKVKRIGID